jgi:hypothetical protein
VTRLPKQWGSGNSGNKEAIDELMPIVYQSSLVAESQF